MAMAEKYKKLFTDYMKALGGLNVISKLLKTLLEVSPRISNFYRVYEFDLGTARNGVNLSTEAGVGAVDVWNDFDRHAALNVSVTNMTGTGTMSINNGEFFTIAAGSSIENEEIKRIVINNTAQQDKTLEIRVDGLV